MKSRRGFLKALGAGALAVPAVAATNLVQASEDTPTRVGDINKEIRRSPYPWIEPPPLVTPLEARKEQDTHILQKARDSASCEIKTSITIEHWSQGLRRDSTLEFRLTDEGARRVVDVCVDCATQITNWRLGLIDNYHFTALCDNDVYDDINQAGNGWDEFVDYYARRDFDRCDSRPEMSNGAQFEFTSPGVIKGMFICGGPNAHINANHSPGNVLFSKGLFQQGDIHVQNGDRFILKGDLV